MDEVDELAAQFVACTLPKSEWTHGAHLTVGLWHVHHFGAERALAMLRDGIRQLNESYGTANTATSGYHETITVAYVRLLDTFRAASDAALPLTTQIDRLLASPLAHRDALHRHYSIALLTSTRARLEWVEPDLAPLA